VSRWKRCKRRDFIKKLHILGFSGPFSGTKHQFMIFQQYRLAVPSNAEFSVPQLHVLLGEVEIIIRQKITLEIWNNLP